MMIEGSVLCWNCRGAGSKDFMREMRELMNEVRPAIVVLLEPRISSLTADAVCAKLGRRRWIQSEATGFSGGIWVLWVEDMFDLRLKNASKFFLHFEVKSTGGKRWELTVVYASPNPSIRRHLWAALDEIVVSDPWLLVGNFNYVLLHDERS